MATESCFVVVECSHLYYNGGCEDKEIVAVYEKKEDAENYIQERKKKYKGSFSYEIECVPFVREKE